MKKHVRRLIQIALMLFIFAMMLSNLMAQPIGSQIKVDTNSQISYWNGSVWIAVTPGLPGQSLQFVSGNPIWINNPNGITTNIVTNNTGTTATSGGIDVSDGGSPIIARGVCWGISHNPTLANSFTTDGKAIGNFVSNLTGLNYITNYYVRAYATNSLGTAYGNEVNFTTLPITDYDGNVYDAVTIGTQTWMKQNLNVTHYLNGDVIPKIIDNTAWGNLITGAYSDFNNDPSYSTIYGRLYNWYTVVDTRNLCPTSWHVPSDAEWITLTSFLGGESIAGEKLREAGLTHWISPNYNASNETGFTALPGGIRNIPFAFVDDGSMGFWWSSTGYDTLSAWYRGMSYNATNTNRGNATNQDGMSVRCLKDQ